VRIRLWAAAAALAAAAHAPAAASPKLIPAQQEIDPASVLDERADGSLLHRQSGFLFPAKLGALPLLGPRVLAADDIMARYSLDEKTGLGDAWLDLILYSAQQPLEDEVSGVESLIVDHFKAKPIADPAPPPAGIRDGHHGWYEGSIDGVGMVTTYVMVKRGGWLVKIRGSAKSSAGRAAVDQLAAAIAAAPWTWVPSADPPAPAKTVANR
jgi:hypothetical protein